MKVFQVDFLVFIHLNWFAIIILLSAVELYEFVAVTNEDVDSHEIVADLFEGHLKVDADDELELV